MQRVAHVSFRRAGPWTVALLLALVYFPTAAWLLHRWSMGVWYQLHGFLVFPIAGWLAWRNLRPLADRPPAASAAGFLFLVPAVLLQALDAMLGFEVLSAVSLILAIPGLSLLFLGREKTRAIWFPLLFLAFAVPIPLMVARRIHMALRYVAAAGTEQVLAFMGYDVAREATTLRVGPHSIEIADACSGFSTLTALFMAGMLLLYLARARWWRGGILLLFVFPAAALANVVRCVVLIMLVAAFDEEILDSFLHPLSGIVTFGLALLLLMQVEKLVVRKGRRA